MNRLAAFALALTVAACQMPLRSASADWQCGRDYIVGSHQYGTIYRNQTGPNGEAEDVWLGLTPPMGSPVWDKLDACKTNKCRNRYLGPYSYDADKGRMYYRGKPCKEIPTTSEQEVSK